MEIKEINYIKKCNGCGEGKEVVIKFENMENREGFKFDIYLCKDCIVKIQNKSDL